MTEVITKYSNRKFYSKTQKRYLSLLDIYLAHKQGADIQVVTHQRKEVITYRTIMQSYAFFADEEDCRMELTPLK
jgi:polyhydroxyalkanoate synthesis regulator protein